MNSKMRTTRHNQRGSVAIIIALTLLLLIGFAGLAIDTGRGYGVKAQLSAAADAASIAGARALANPPSATQAERVANAQAAAQRFFQMNYPDSYHAGNVSAPTVNVVPAGNGRWDVTVNAEATMPNFFMAALGNNDTTVRTISQATRVNPDIMMVLDESGSMNSQLPQLKSAAKDGFVSKFIPDADGDRIGVVTYASGSSIAEPINKNSARGFNRAAVDSAIDGMQGSGWTSTSDAMRKALNELNAVPLNVRSDRRIMLVFSDGAPNMLPVQQSGQRANIDPNGAYWEANSLSTTKSGFTVPLIPAFAVGNIPTTGRLNLVGNAINHCNIGKSVRNLTENVATMARSQGIRIYTIGLGASLNSVEWPLSDIACGTGGQNNTNEYGSALLRRIANTDINNPDYDSTQQRGLYCEALVANELERCFAKIANDILRLTM